MSSGAVVLVTGGAGFIGANLCKRLVVQPGIAEVRVLDNLSTGYQQNLADVNVRLDVGSILDEDALEAGVRGCSHIVHLAAVPSVPRSIQAPLQSHEANATGSLRVLEAARRHGGLHVILASSSSVYGANPELPKHEGLLCQPMSPYAVSKLAAEQYASAYAHCYALPVLPLRFFNVFGPLQAAGHAYAAVVPAFVDAALRGRPIPIAGDGLQSRDFTFVASVVDVITSAILHQTASSPVNLAFGTRTDLMTLVQLLERILDQRLPVEHGDGRPGDVPHSQASSVRFHSLFPEAQPISLEAGLRQTVDWFRASQTGLVG